MYFDFELKYGWVMLCQGVGEYGCASMTMGAGSVDLGVERAYVSVVWADFREDKRKQASDLSVNVWSSVAHGRTRKPRARNRFEKKVQVAQQISFGDQI